jgi:hypothetical protein
MLRILPVAGHEPLADELMEDLIDSVSPAERALDGVAASLARPEFVDGVEDAGLERCQHGGIPSFEGVS